MQAAHHWEVLADQVAKEVKYELARLDGMQDIEGIEESEATQDQETDKTPETGKSQEVTEERPPIQNRPYLERPVYVQQGDHSPFGESFEILLKSALMKQGIMVSFNPHASLRIDWGVKKIFHNTDRIKRTPGIIGAVFMVPVWVAAGDGFVTGPLQHSEVIISTCFSEDGLILTRNSAIFYVNDMDFCHYFERPLPGDGPAVQLAQKTYTVADH